MKHLKLFPLLCCLILSFTSESQTNYRSSISSNQQTANSPAHSKKVVGYFAQWAIYGRDYNVLDIEGDKLTHIMYAFFDTTFDAATETSSIESIDSYADFEHNESGMHPSSEPVKGNIGDLRLLKQNYPHLKVLISLGGWTRSQNFPALAKSVNGRLTLAQSMVNFMETYTWIDGFDIDWEFPVEGGIQGETVNGMAVPDQPHFPEDHKNLVFLLKKIREVFDANSMQDKLLTMAAGNNVTNLLATHVGPGTEATHGMTENIFDFCDFVTFFGYDFGGNWFDKACYNAPLYGGDHPDDPLNRGAGNPNQVLNDLVGLYINNMAVPSEKLIMGVPFYGKLFEGVASTGIVPTLPGLYEAAPRVNNPACTNPQPPKGSWDALNCENSGSIEFCDLFQGIASTTHHYLDSTNPLSVSSSAATAGWVRYWDDTAKVPYLYNPTENKFISYDDGESIDLKVKYALSKEMGGVMIWELSQDARDSDQGLLDVIDNSLLAATYDITLNFKDSSDTAIQGVSVDLKDENDTILQTLTSNSAGQVVFENQTAFVPYTVTYSYSSYAFLPSQVSLEALEFDSNTTLNILGSNQTSQISGSVKENGQLLTDVNVILKDDNGQELERMVSSDGNFVFGSVINNLDYTLTAEKDYYSITSLSYTNLTANQTAQELVAARNSHAISGRVTSSNTGLENVSIAIVGNAQTFTTTTDSNGNYSIMNLPAGYDYVVSPTLNSTVFNPTTRTINLLNSDTTANFVENQGLIYGTVKQGSTPISGAHVSLIVPWTDNNHPYQNIAKMTNSAGEYFYTETELDGYNTISSLKLETYQNNNVTYYPTDLANIIITETPQEFNFNSQPVTPTISIDTPNTSSIDLAYGNSVNLEATVDLSYDDGTTTLASVVFKIDGVVVSTTTVNNTYSASWLPSDSDYGSDHTFKVEAEASNGEIATETFDFSINCTGSGCPNLPPKIVWSAPSNTTINQNSGFMAIPIEVVVTDSDGIVTTVMININGSSSLMTAGPNNTYTYSFTPLNHQDYPLTITATDNENATATYTETLSIINSQFVPLPSGPILLGYAHSWENASAPFLYFRDMKDKKYNVVMYSFIETENQNGYTPQLTINNNRYLTSGTFDEQLLIDDIQSLRDEGIPVIASIGGANGHVELTTEAQKDEFVEGLKTIIDKYNFDGVDLDFEGTSMNFQAGALTDFSYTGISAYPRLKLVVDAFKELKQHYGSGFIMTCAPETAYVQTGYFTYGNTSGSFLPVLHNLRDELDLVMVQLYNSGTVFGLDNKLYTQATPDFITALSDLLMTNFKVASTGFTFPALAASKIMVAIPSCPDAAPNGGYLQPSEAIKALNYLRFGTTFSGRTYTLQNESHPDLRGVMTWSINWDAAAGCASAYEFSNSYDSYFNSPLNTVNHIFDQSQVQVFPNPFDDGITIQSDLKIRNIKIYNINGKKVFSQKLPDSSLNLNFLVGGFYFAEFQTDSKTYYKKLLKK